MIYSSEIVSPTTLSELNTFVAGEIYAQTVKLVAHSPDIVHMSPAKPLRIATTPNGRTQMQNSLIENHKTLAAWLEKPTGEILQTESRMINSGFVPWIVDPITGNTGILAIIKRYTNQNGEILKVDLPAGGPENVFGLQPLKHQKSAIREFVEETALFVLDKTTQQIKLLLPEQIKKYPELFGEIRQALKFALSKGLKINPELTRIFFTTLENPSHAIYIQATSDLPKQLGSKKAYPTPTRFVISDPFGEESYDCHLQMHEQGGDALQAIVAPTQYQPVATVDMEYLHLPNGGIQALLERKTAILTPDDLTKIKNETPVCLTTLCAKSLHPSRETLNLTFAPLLGAWNQTFI